MLITFEPSQVLKTLGFLQLAL